MIGIALLVIVASGSTIYWTSGSAAVSVSHAGSTYKMGGGAPVKVFHAGSLSRPFEKINEENNSFNLQREPSGSVEVIQKITELGKRPDVVAVSDYSLIEDYLIPKYTDWYVQFARNEIGIAYTDSSRYSNKIDNKNWYKILLKPDVRFGFGNPDADPGGYRALMAVQLSEIFYDNSEIFDDLIASNTRMKAPTQENGTYTIEAVPFEELLPPFQGVDWSVVGIIWVSVIVIALVLRIRRMKYRMEITLVALIAGIAFTGLALGTSSPVTRKVKVGSMEVALIPALEEGSIDYMFNYKSIAKQYGFNFLSLPEEVNLSMVKHKNIYQKVRIRLTDGTLKQGKPIVYGVSTLENAKHEEASLKFLRYLLSDDGLAVFENMGQPPINPPRTNSLDNVPKEIRDLVIEYES